MLPLEKHQSGIVDKALAADFDWSVFKDLQVKSTQMLVAIPMFQCQTNVDLTAVLANMGLSSLLQPGTNDFSGDLLIFFGILTSLSR